jgi:CRISPR-associated endonuclease/helicase Cas3
MSICKREREENPASQLDSGISDRFWKLTRHYGWWGLAYLEALFRLSDWKASENEGTEVWE